jgi:hypothetical protein
MKTKFGSIIVAGSGKIGGHVASKNRAGSYLRTKVTPVNPSTSAQAEARNLLASLASAWSGLTPEQRSAWNGAVDQYKKTDIFGDLRTPSGFNLYCMLNDNLVRIGESAITTPPAPVALPVITTGVLAAVHDGALTVTFETDPVVTASVIEVMATPALSAGKSFVKSELRRIGSMGALTQHVGTLTTLYNTKFGAVGAAGGKVFVQLRQISNVTGQAGVPVLYSAIIS